MSNQRNWRNTGDYEFTNSLSDEGWAWEFLRRNENYIKDWKKWLRWHVLAKKASKDDINKSKFRVNKPILSQKWGLHYGFVNPGTDNPHYLNFTRTRASLEVTLKRI